MALSYCLYLRDQGAKGLAPLIFVGCNGGSNQLDVYISCVL
jgi:hypothetical protein